jgi:hypothetical protein
LRLVAPLGTVVVDRMNMQDLPSLLHMLQQNLGHVKVCGLDCEWGEDAHGVDLIQLGTSTSCLLIRACDWPVHDTGVQLAPPALHTFLASLDVQKVGICIGNDKRRLNNGHGVVVNPYIELGDLARTIYPSSGVWGMAKLVKVFINPMKTVVGKGTIDHSNWSKQTTQLSKAQKLYAIVDALVIVLLYVLMQREITAREATELSQGSENRVLCTHCGSSEGVAALSVGGVAHCIDCFVLVKFPSCTCSELSGGKCLQCQCKPCSRVGDTALELATANESLVPVHASGIDPEHGDHEDDDTPIEPSCDYKADGFHLVAAVLTAGGIKHCTSGSGSTALSMILYMWESACYQQIVLMLQERHKLSPLQAKLLVARYRRMNPDKVKNRIRPLCCYHCWPNFGVCMLASTAQRPSGCGLHDQRPRRSGIV